MSPLRRRGVGSKANASHPGLPCGSLISPANSPAFFWLLKSFARSKSRSSRRWGAEARVDLGRNRLDDFGQWRSGLRPGGGRDIGWRRGRSELAGADDLFDLETFEGFVFEQTIGNHLQLFAVAIDDLFGAAKGFVDDALDLVIDVLGGLFAVILAAADFAAKEDKLVVVAILDHAELIAHAPLANHRAHELSGVLDISGRAGGDIFGDDFFGDTARHGDCNDVQHLLALAVENIVFGQIHGGAERLPAWNDGNLMQWVRVFEHHVDQGMASFVPGGEFLIFIGHRHAAAFAAPTHFVARFLEFGHTDRFLARACG